MNSYEFCHSAYLGAAKYYQYIKAMQHDNSLDPHKGVAGCSSHRITSITPVENTSTDFFCSVEGKILDVDSSEVNQTIPLRSLNIRFAGIRLFLDFLLNSFYLLLRSPRMTFLLSQTLNF